MYTECLSEIVLSDKFSEDKEYELITTAKQTDVRYGDFEYSKEDLETMAKNFNDNIVGTEIPVDLNHDPEHIALAWIKPGSMVVKESSQLEGKYSLYAQLYRFTPDGEQKVKTGALRYFSLQIQHQMAKFVDNTKKVYKLVIRALALTNMPVIKDMAPTYGERNLLFFNHSQTMEKAELEVKLAEKDVALTQKDQLLSEKDAEIKRLSDEVEAEKTAKREIELADQVEELCLSEDKAVGFKGGEKETVLAFVKTLSDEQATQYFAIHKNIIASVNLNEEGTGEDTATVADADAEAEVAKLASVISSKEGISLSEAAKRVLSENPELAKKLSN